MYWTSLLSFVGQRPTTCAGGLFKKIGRSEYKASNFVVRHYSSLYLLEFVGQMGNRKILGGTF